MKVLRFVLGVTLFAGSCLVARAGYLRAKAEAASVLIHRAWEQTIRTGVDQPPWPWADTHPAARLRIPRIGYDEIVLEGASPRILAFGPARLLSSALPGEPGNLAVAGHRTSWFRRLEDVRTGDDIEVEWFDARSHQVRNRTYEVDGIHIVNPTDVELLAPTPDDALTLITCYPFGKSPGSPKRYVVRAVPSGLNAASR
jgi:sortase A